MLAHDYSALKRYLIISGILKREHYIVQGKRTLNDMSFKIEVLPKLREKDSVQIILCS